MFRHYILCALKHQGDPSAAEPIYKLLTLQRLPKSYKKNNGLSLKQNILC